MTTISAPKVLVVDDHVDLAENIAEILAASGYEAVVAASAEEGLDRVAAGDITALITDYRLPGRSGAELIAELRRRGQRVPALVISAFSDDDTVAHARAAGAADVLPKPVDLGKLLGLMSQLTRDDGVVLLVDDNRELAENLAEVLRSGGHQAHVCFSVAEVRALSGVPRAAVIDYRLPDGTGLDVARQLATRDARIPILFISGHGSELQEHLRDGSAAGAHALEKPVDVGRLLAWVAEALGRGATERPRR
jgi:DNA-binding response OmpR family regulator